MIRQEHIRNRRILAILIAIHGLIGMPTLSSAGVIEDHPWLSRADANQEIQLPSLSAEREAELAESESGFTDLRQHVDLKWEADGTVVERIVVIRRFHNTDGIDQAGEMSIFAAPSNESLVLHAAYTLTGSGERFDVDPLTLQVVDVEEARIFSGQKRVVLPLPALSEGATSVVSYTLRNRAQNWPLPWARSYQLQSGNPVGQMVITAESIPRGIVWKTQDPDIDCRVSGRNLRCVKSKIPALHPDVDLSLARDSIHNLVIGESLAWKDVSQRVHSIVEPQIRKGVPAGTAEKLIASKSSELEKWEALFQFVADDIRYLGLEKGDSAVVPHPPALTLRRRFGDCKDKVTLLVALARQVSLEAYPVLVGTEYYDVDSLILPSSNYFNHMVACVTTREGETRCADPTINGAHSTETALNFAGQVSLPLQESAGDVATLSIPPFGWSTEVDGVTQIRCDGSVQASTKRQLGGLAKLSARQQYLGIEPAMRKRFMLDEARRVTGTTQLAALEIAGFRDRDAPITVSSSIQSPSTGTPLQSNSLYFEQDPWIVHYGTLFRIQNQYFAAWNPGIRIRSTHRYEICDEMRPRFFGPVLEMESEFGFLKRTYQKTARGLKVETVLQMPSGAVQPDQFARRNHFLEQSLKQTLIWFDLEAKP